MLSYAGVDLPLFNAEAVAWVEANLSFQDILEFTYLDSPSFYLGHLAYPGVLPRRPIQPGRLYWPRGASRFAVGYFLVSDAQAMQIRSAVESGSYTAAPLVMTWENAVTGAEVARIQPNLFLLPLRPLSQIAGENGCWLMTLVDERYFWWQKNSGNLSISEGSTTWEDLYTALGTALNQVITVDAIPAAYLKPAAWLGVPYDYVPLLLDAVAYNVGQRIVRGLDGVVRARNAVNGAADVVANRALAAARSVQAGGTFLFNGSITPNDIPPQAPQSVTLTFPEVNADSGTNLANGVLLAQSVTLAALGLPDIPANTPTSPGSKTFHETAPAQYLAGTLQNQAELTAMLRQIATDYYRFQLGPLDVKYAGVVPWNPEPLNDSVEWIYTAHGGAQGDGEVSTRIQRPPFNDLTQELDHGGGAGGASPPPSPPGGGGGPTQPCTCLPVYPPYPLPPSTPDGTIPLPAGYAKVRFAPQSTLNVTGFSGAVNGQILILWNAGAGTKVVLAHNVGTPASAGILTPLGYDYTLWPNDGLIIEYDGLSQRWRFDCPTFAAGFSSGGQAATYASRWLKPGTGILITDQGDGSDVISATPAGGTAAGNDISFWRQEDHWYCAGRYMSQGAGDPTTVGAFANFLRATPFLCTRPGAVINQIAVAVGTPSTSVVSNARLGIYNSSPAGISLRPTTLLVDFGDLDLSGGVGGTRIQNGVPTALVAGRLYWIVCGNFDDGSGAAPIVRDTANIDMWCILGGISTVPFSDRYGGWVSASAWLGGALPAVFPAANPEEVSNFIHLAVHLGVIVPFVAVLAAPPEGFAGEFLPGGAGAVLLG